MTKEEIKNALTAGVIHRLINSAVLLVLIISMFVFMDGVKCVLEKEHTVQECQTILYEELVNDGH